MNATNHPDNVTRSTHALSRLLATGVLLSLPACAALTGATEGMGTVTKGAADIKGIKEGGTGLVKDAKGAADEGKGGVEALAQGGPDAKKRLGEKCGKDPDCDGTRMLCQLGKPNEAINDEVNTTAKDLVDWRIFELPGTPGRHHREPMLGHQG